MLNRYNLTVAAYLFAAGMFLAATASAAQAAKLTEEQVAEHTGKIDALVDAGLEKAGVRPNAQAKDDVFLRRAYLDIIGRGPSYEEAEGYLDSRDNKRRVKLINTLLDSRGRASHEFNYWADIVRATSSLNNNASGGPYIDWMKDSFRNNVPFDKFVYELLTASGPYTKNGAVGYYVRDNGMPLDNASNTIRIFLGTQLGCAQCHDHPFDKWTQMEFYEMASFTYGINTRDDHPKLKELNQLARQLQREGNTDTDRENFRLGQRIQNFVRSLSWGAKDTGNQLRLPHDYKYSDGSPNQPVKPFPIFEPDVSESSELTARQKYAKWMTSKDNPRFALVVANRYWKRAFGIGLIEPHDEITDDTKPSNPELMAYLTQLMKDLDFDLKEYQRVIFNTKAYQREATRGQIKEGEQYAFPGPLLRRMTAEQMWDTLITLTVPDVDASPVSSLGTLDDSASSPLDTLTAEQIVENIKKGGGGMMAMGMDYRNNRNALMRASELSSPAPPGHVLERFGQSDRQLIETSSTDPSVTQALNLMNGWIDGVLLKKQSVLYENVMRARSNIDKVNVIWLSILGRNATPQERAVALAEVKDTGDLAFHNLVWALLNSREFIFIQ